MAYTYVWPTLLPQSPQRGFKETGGVLILRTPQDAGPAKMRKVGARPQTLDVNFMMTTAQVAIFETFVKTTISGTARFGFTHPRTKSIVETRIVPQQEGTLYTLDYTAPGYWTVNLQLEILP